MTMLGPNSFKKAIEEAEKLSESLKLRLYDLDFIVHNLLNNTRHNIHIHKNAVTFCFYFNWLIIAF